MDISTRQSNVNLRLSVNPEGQITWIWPQVLIPTLIILARQLVNSWRSDYNSQSDPVLYALHMFMENSLSSKDAALLLGIVASIQAYVLRNSLRRSWVWALTYVPGIALLLTDPAMIAEALSRNLPSTALLYPGMVFADIKLIGFALLITAGIQGVMLYLQGNQGYLEWFGRHLASLIAFMSVLVVRQIAGMELFTDLIMRNYLSLLAYISDSAINLMPVFFTALSLFVYTMTSKPALIALLDDQD